MIEQLSIFATGVECNHCKQDPGRDPRNGYMWNGFKDMDNGQYCCWKCKDVHYYYKAQSEHKHKYSEFPVVVPAAA